MAEARDKLRVACVQMTTAGDRAANVAQARELVGRAAAGAPA